MIKKAEAIVLKTLNHGDTSKIITLYSREAGRLKLIAKGVRSPKSKAAGLFQPTRHLQIIYYHKPNSGLQLFKSGELISGFFGLEQGFDRLTLAQVVVELLDRSIEDEEAHPRLFQLLADTLKRLSEGQTSSARVFWFFHLHLLKELGYYPHVDHCSVCHEPLSAGAYLGIGNPLPECVKCHQPGQESIFVTPQILETIREILESSLVDLKKPELNAGDRRKLWDFLWRYTFHHIEPTRGMKSLKVLRQLYG